MLVFQLKQEQIKNNNMWALNGTWDLSHMTAASLPPINLCCPSLSCQRGDETNKCSCTVHAAKLINEQWTIKEGILCSVSVMQHQNSVLFFASQWNYALLWQCVVTVWVLTTEGRLWRRKAAFEITCLHNICRLGRKTQPNIICGETGVRQHTLHSNPRTYKYTNYLCYWAFTYDIKFTNNT